MFDQHFQKINQISKISQTKFSKLNFLELRKYFLIKIKSQVGCVEISQNLQYYCVTPSELGASSLRSRVPYTGHVRKGLSVNAF